jgi:hypothetical protein
MSQLRTDGDRSMLATASYTSVGHEADRTRWLHDEDSRPSPVRSMPSCEAAVDWFNPIVHPNGSMSIAAFAPRPVTLGPPLFDARLHPMRAGGVDDQRSSWDTGARRAEPPQRIEEADPLHANVLARS